MLKELQSLGMDVIVQDKDGNEIDMRQNFDDEETGFDMRDVASLYNIIDSIFIGHGVGAWPSPVWPLPFR